ncbi:MAG TPA: gamma-glutamylcyclotransferase [Thermohalobaculum sp.]|nr:gamma-glutamylcyclotransferase [Thermohalobaculum sp.]
MKPIFFYGTLRDRASLEAVLGRAVGPAGLEPASVEGFTALRLVGEDYPVLVPAPGRRADGVLLGDASEAELDRIRFFEGAEYAVAPITVATARGPVEAVHLRGTERARASSVEWDYGEWCRSHRATALESTREYMAQYGRRSAAEIDAIWPAIRNRARQRARARAAEPRTGGIRTAFGPGDVETLACARAYAGFVAVDELTLRHRRFDGGWSAPVSRSVVAYGDAVTVLPYDPRRDRVLLIEQFRPAPFARGDRNPWCIEVVAGRVDRPEPAAATARREAAEEAGLTLGRLAGIGSYYPTPGLDCENMTSFVGEAELEGGGGLHGLAGEGEDIRSLVLSFDAAMAALAEGAVNTGPALVSLLWLAANRARLRAEWARIGVEAPPASH